MIKAFCSRKFCGNGPDIWIRLQTARDLWTAKRKMADVVSRIPTMAAG